MCGHAFFTGCGVGIGLALVGSWIGWHMDKDTISWGSDWGFLRDALLGTVIVSLFVGTIFLIVTGL